MNDFIPVDRFFWACASLALYTLVEAAEITLETFRSNVRQERELLEPLYAEKQRTANNRSERNGRVARLWFEIRIAEARQLNCKSLGYLCQTRAVPASHG